MEADVDAIDLMPFRLSGASLHKVVNENRNLQSDVSKCRCSPAMHLLDGSICGTHDEDIGARLPGALVSGQQAKMPS
jgi:hypothetical protein